MSRMVALVSEFRLVKTHRGASSAGRLYHLESTRGPRRGRARDQHSARHQWPRSATIQLVGMPQTRSPRTRLP